MGVECRSDAEASGLSKEKGDVAQCPDIGITDDMVHIIVVEGIFKGIKIEPYAYDKKDKKYSKPFHFTYVDKLQNICLQTIEALAKVLKTL